ncbi:hypothetical protein [Rhodoferax ferrireducens]|uniref:hypothetical protein n=1 Tax=Rhodoferax ferrireducens TaxID=192843 RepID=UPI003BB6F447
MNHVARAPVGSLSDKKTADKFHIANLDRRTDPALARRFDVIGDGKAKPTARARAGVSRPKWQPSENLPLKIAKNQKTPLPPVRIDWSRRQTEY